MCNSPLALNPINIVQERSDIQLRIQFVTSFAFLDWEMSKDADVVTVVTPNSTQNVIF
jgi:hypothetical protein